MAGAVVIRASAEPPSSRRLSWRRLVLHALVLLVYVLKREIL